MRKSSSTTRSGCVLKKLPKAGKGAVPTHLRALKNCWLGMLQFLSALTKKGVECVKLNESQSFYRECGNRWCSMKRDLNLWLRSLFYFIRTKFKEFFMSVFMTQLPSIITNIQYKYMVRLVIIFGIFLSVQFTNASSTTTQNKASIASIPTLNVVQLSTAYSHSCAIINSGCENSVYCWGDNQTGALGIGSGVSNSNKPKKVTIPGSPLKIATGGSGKDFSCAIVDNTGIKELYCWGHNDDAELGIAAGNTTRQLLPVKINIPGIPIDIKLGFSHSCAITADNTNVNQLYCWGDNGEGAIGIGLAAGAIRVYTPTLITLPNNEIPSGLALGKNGTCTSTIAGNLYCWGRSSYTARTSNQYSPVLISGVTNPISIALGDSIACAISNLNKEYCWGQNFLGSFGNGTSSNSYQSPTGNPNLINAKVVSTGFRHTCTIINSTVNSLRCSGSNQYGELGYGIFSTNSTTPVLTTLPTNTLMPKSVSVGGSNTCAIYSTPSNGDQIYCTGLGSFGQIGNASYANMNIMQLVDFSSIPIVTNPGPTALYMMGNHTNVNNFAQSPSSYFSSDGSNFTSSTILPSTWYSGAGRGWFPSVYFNQKIWILGGYDSNRITNAVFNSLLPINSPWSSQISTTNIWSPRIGHKAVVFNGKIWVMGGSDSNGSSYPFHYMNDVWSSPDGINWTLVNPNAPWSPRAPRVLTVFKNKLLLFGSDPFGGYGDTDVWTSSDGISWTQLTPSVRGSISQFGAASFNDGSGEKLYFIGTNSTTGILTNTLFTSNDGINWSASYQFSFPDPNIFNQAHMYVYRPSQSSCNQLWIIDDYATFLITSSNGLNWHQVNMNTNPFGYYDNSTILPVNNP